MPVVAYATHVSGPLLQLAVGIGEEERRALKAAGVSTPRAEVITALIDTGASISAIDPEVLGTLGLVPISQIQINTVSSGGDDPMNADQYEVALHVGAGQREPTLSFGAIAVISAPLRYLGYDCLVGRDVLSRCLFVYDGKHQQFTLAF